MLESCPATSVMLVDGSIGLKCHKLELGDGARPLIISSLCPPSCLILLLPFWCKYFKTKKKNVVIISILPVMFHVKEVPC